ncbi:hypothetical protein [Allonocardiopsis opalescens]|uniref:Uncharacterized protein n=1 Tax=Allonocardiopsis opalescens TaxID=1144618 RepID=A0A2T0Q7M2_9ACTN|nr:hypothetical protein [Allonocardiopsis opalescens]PRX99827.1 hypothetical protein CLV72_103434 [Allonocardiopsis opalescens]
MAIIQSRHVRELLAAPDPGAALVVRRGAAAVVGGDSAAESAEGALVVATQADLRAQGAAPESSDDQIAALAARLDTALAGFGG